jgi:hypothetical protein
MLEVFVLVKTGQVKSSLNDEFSPNLVTLYTSRKKFYYTGRQKTNFPSSDSDRDFKERLKCTSQVGNGK